MGVGRLVVFIFA